MKTLVKILAVLRNDERSPDYCWMHGCMRWNCPPH